MNSEGKIICPKPIRKKINSLELKYSKSTGFNRLCNNDIFSGNKFSEFILDNYKNPSSSYYPYNNYLKNSSNEFEKNNLITYKEFENEMNSELVKESATSEILSILSNKKFCVEENFRLKKNSKLSRKGLAFKDRINKENIPAQQYLLTGNDYFNNGNSSRKIDSYNHNVNNTNYTKNCNSATQYFNNLNNVNNYKINYKECLVSQDDSKIKNLMQLDYAEKADIHCNNININDKAKDNKLSFKCFSNNSKNSEEEEEEEDLEFHNLFDNNNKFEGCDQTKKVLKMLEENNQNSHSITNANENQKNFVNSAYIKQEKAFSLEKCDCDLNLNIKNQKINNLNFSSNITTKTKSFHKNFQKLNKRESLESKFFQDAFLKVYDDSDVFIELNNENLNNQSNYQIGAGEFSFIKLNPRSNLFIEKNYDVKVPTRCKNPFEKSLINEGANKIKKFFIRKGSEIGDKKALESDTQLFKDFLFKENINSNTEKIEFVI